MVLVTMLLVGCSGTFGSGARRALPVVNATALAVSTGSLLWDAHQTRKAAQEQWRGREEGGGAGMVIGSRPSVLAVDLYFAVAIAANTAAWWFIPERWRTVIPGVIIGVQAVTITGNRSIKECRVITSPGAQPVTECKYIER